MNRYISIVLLAGIAASWAAGEDIVFHKSKTVERNGWEHEVDLLFLTDEKAMVVREKTAVVIEIPYQAPDKLTYDYSQRHR